MTTGTGNGSKPGRLDKTDLRKLAIGAGIAAAGGVAAYLSTEVIPGLQEAGKDEIALLVVILSVVVGLIRKLVQNNETKPAD